MAQLSELISDPSWFPAMLDTKANSLGFAKIGRDSIAKEAFLDNRMAGSVTAHHNANLASVVNVLVKEKQPNSAFVFHSAFCCSTLLARALDMPGKAVSLKEPDVLMGLANALRVDDKIRQSASHCQMLVDSIFTLLARRFDDNESILIKPTNTANNLLPHAVTSGAQIVLLYGDLRNFLVSVLKKGEACKSFVRKQFNIFALDAKGLSIIPQRQAVAFTDLQIAAIVWRHQMELFHQTLNTANPKQVVSLDFKNLMAEPVQVLSAVVAHLQLPHTKEDIESIANGPVFTRNAKFSNQDYNADQRKQEAKVIEERYGETLDVIEKWASQLHLGMGLKMPLGNAIGNF